MEIKDKIKSNRHKQIGIVIVALVCIICVLFQFSKDVNVYKGKVNIQSLKRISMQSASIIENELQQYLNFITKLSKNLEKEDIYSQDVMDTIKYLCNFSDFQRIGIADTSGHAHVTNGEEVSLKGRDFFEKAMQGNYCISDALESRILNEKIIAISAPIYNDGDIKGVVYGIMELRHVPLLKNNAMETDYHWLDIVDGNGRFIRKGSTVEEKYGDTDCVFDILKHTDINMDIEELKSLFYKQEEVLLEATHNDEHSYVYLKPLNINQWYLVSVIDQSYYETTVGLGFDTAVMNTIGLIIAVFMVCGVVISYLYHKEQKYIKDLNEYLAYNDEIYRVATTKSDNIVFVYDIVKDDLQFINGHFESLYRSEAMNTSFKALMRDLMHDEDVQKQLLELENSHEDYETEIQLENDHKKEYYGIYMSYLADPQSSHNRCVGVIRNITEDKLKEKQLKKKGQIDSLTKLYNRAAGEEKIKKLLQGDHSHALVLIDVDDFKKINDTLGHDYGDSVLKDVGRVLKQHFRSNDVICRLGGDEFVVLINDIPEDVVLKVVNVLMSKIQSIYSHENSDMVVNISAGVAMYPVMGTTFEELYKKADKALYKSKYSGKNQCYIYQNDEDAK